jgi:hypothetical protein
MAADPAARRRRTGASRTDSNCGRRGTARSRLGLGGGPRRSPTGAGLRTPRIARRTARLFANVEANGASVIGHEALREHQPEELAATMVRRTACCARSVSPAVDTQRRCASARTAARARRRGLP